MGRRMLECLSVEPGGICAARGEVMSVVVDSQTQQFAVISVRREPCRERLVLAYGDEKGLRECLAEASIVGLGYRSREEALRNIDNSVTSARASVQNQRAGLGNRIAQLLRISGKRQLPSLGRFNLLKNRRMVVQVLQHGFVFAIVLVYSKNAFSGILRALVSF